MLQRAAYAFVEAGGPIPAPAIQTIPPDVQSYLDDHRTNLLERAAAEKLAEAHFVDANALDRFEKIARGTDAEFLAASNEIAVRLHAGMDQRSRRGFFVAATYSVGQTLQSMVLKLDANPKTLAAIGGTTTNPVLQSVDDLLDIPGELQKGSVHPDPRAHSDVCVGDKNRETSLYYLNAIEVGQNELPGKGVAALLGVVQDHSPGHLEPVTRALETTQGRTTASAVLQAATPAIPASEQATILGRLSNLKRPVTDVDSTAHAVKGIIEVDGMTVGGPAARIRDDVNWVRDSNGTGYIIQVRVAHLPTKRYQ